MAQIKEEEWLYHVTLSVFLISIWYFRKFESIWSKKKIPNFGDSIDFLHQFKKILARNCKKGQCYVIAWLFHFKMSPNTAGYGDYLLFFAYSRVLRYRCVKPAEMMAEEHRALHLPYEISCVTEECCPGIMTYPFSLHITWQIGRSNNTKQHTSKKKTYIGPLPPPPPILLPLTPPVPYDCRWACLSSQIA